LKEARELVHGTCVAFGRRAVLLRGEPGAGKSDLALRFLALPPEAKERPALVADDQVWIAVGAEGALMASPPAALAGKIEVRGLGIVEVPFLPEAELKLVCDLVGETDVPRMPPETWERTEIAGIALPALKLAPFEASAPLKLKMALFLAAPADPK
jgi:serine kinase of HPr protein (carbohydrate metabolism regulator)